MDKNDVTMRLRHLLLPVFGLESIDEIPLGASLVKDIGADSLDFVEITYLIEKEFGVVLKTSELLLSGAAVDSEHFFLEGRLTGDGAALLNRHLGGGEDGRTAGNADGKGGAKDDAARFRAGMSKMDLFQALTVDDLADAIGQRLPSRGASC